jgi:hypothetical protein
LPVCPSYRSTSKLNGIFAQHNGDVCHLNTLVVTFSKGSRMAPFSPDPSAQCRKVKTAWPSIELGTPRPFVGRGHFGQTLYGRAKYMRSPEANNGQLPANSSLSNSEKLRQNGDGVNRTRRSATRFRLSQTGLDFQCPATKFTAVCVQV